MKHDKEVQKAIDERFKNLKGYHRNERDERFSKKKYADWIRSSPKYEGREDVRANPDLLDQNNTLFKKRTVEDKRLHDLVMANLDQLTAKERKVLSYLRAGKTMQETGDKLGYSVSAIESFLNKIRSKFEGIKNEKLDAIDEDEQ